MRTIDPPRLHELIKDLYTLEDVREMCFYLYVAYDDLPGDGRSAKLLSLIQRLTLEARLPELVAYVQRTRPQAALDTVYRQEPEATAASRQALAPPARDALGHVRRYLQRGRLLLFVGADLDETITGVPSRHAIAASLAQAEAVPGDQPLAAVAQQLMQYGNRWVVTDHLRTLYSRAAKDPQPFHQMLANLALHHNLETLVTTAYDDLLLQAFRDAGVYANLVLTDANLRTASFDVPTIIQLYGLWQQNASLVLSEQDLNRLIRGQSPERRNVLDALRQAFLRNALLFIGSDLTDTAVTAIYDEFAGQELQLPAFAVWPGLPAPQADTWRTTRGVTVIDAHPLTVLRSLLEM